jgi:hypothetical protein
MMRTVWAKVQGARRLYLINDQCDFVEPVQLYLDHLIALEKSPNTRELLLLRGIAGSFDLRQYCIHVSANYREAHMLRSICAVIISVVTWFLVATVGNLLLRALLPGYTAVEAAMSFTLPMKLARLALGLISSLSAGIVCAAIANPGSQAAKVVAGIMVALFIPVHFMLWAKFPVWYHLFFLLSLAPAVLLGASMLPKRSMEKLAT